jgi:hypothetical protein
MKWIAQNRLSILADLSSTNGTFVDNEKIETHELRLWQCSVRCKVWVPRQISNRGQSPPAPSTQILVERFPFPMNSKGYDRIYGRPRSVGHSQRCDGEQEFQAFALLARRS